MKTKFISGAAVIFMVLISVSGCQYLKKRVEKKEKTDYTLNSSGIKSIEINNSNGNVDLISINDTLGKIYIIAEKTGRVRINETDKPIEGVDVIIDSTGDVIRIDTDFNKTFSIFGNKNEARVNFVVKVPASMNVLVNLTNGTINAEGMILESNFETINGPIYINNCTGSINAKTVNGSVKANIDSIKHFTVETINGSVTIGNLKYANANVEASCVNGKVKTENLNFSSMTSEKRELSGRLGNGSGLMKISTVNGSIKLDGNYISYKKKDNIDWDFKFEFDDNDEPVKIEIEHSNEKKGVQVTPRDTVKRADSVKQK